MPTAEARVRTDRASRYLTQLCRHLGQMGRMRHRSPVGHGGGEMPPEIRHVEYSDTDGIIRFAEGRCTLQARSDTLTLRVEADDEDTLQRLQDGIAGRIEKIGRRDRLKVNWQRLQGATAPAGEAADPAAVPEAGARKRLGPGGIVGLGAVGVVIVAVHLGLGGAALAASPWTSWGVNALLAVVALTLVFVGGHLVLGRLGVRAFRHRR
ncbi:DUF2218 domain-containing protein [Streptomyces sp. NPDC001984]|uniref:DUF2218 domain-containing protein n=1 Tax=Streptomyces sp. NPDC002619 TaxID=3364655 RepID=UPI003689289F